MKHLSIIAIFGAIAVILGAFGAHGLKALIAPESLTVWQTGVQYQFYHTLGLLFVWQLWQSSQKPVLLLRAMQLMMVGILFFSGSVYLLACKDLLALGGFTKVLGPITPIGGVLFITSWLTLAYWAFKSKS